MSSIDDPIDAFLTQYPEQPKNVLGETALDLAGAVHWTFKVVNIVRARFFSSTDAMDGLRNLATAMKLQFEWLQQELSTQQERIAEIDAKLDSPGFKQATVVATVEAQSGASETKIDEMAAVLVRSLVSVPPGEYSDDLVGFVRDIVNMTSKDVEVLRLLAEVFGDVIATAPNLDAPDMFTPRMSDLRKAVDQRMHRDDFYSHCERLSGFGLAIELPRNPAALSPDEYCFRPTRRGLTLLRLLGDASSRHADWTAVGLQSQGGRNSGSDPSTSLLAGANRVIVAPVSRATSEQ